MSRNSLSSWELGFFVSFFFCLIKSISSSSSSVQFSAAEFGCFCSSASISIRAYLCFLSLHNLFEDSSPESKKKTLSFYETWTQPSHSLKVEPANSKQTDESLMLTRLWKSKRSISFGSGSFTYDLNNCIMGDIPPWCWFFCRRKDAELWTRLDIFSSSGLNQKSPSEPVGGRSQHHQRLQLRHFRIHLRSGSGIIEQAVLSAQTATPSPLTEECGRLAICNAGRVLFFGASDEKVVRTSGVGGAKVLMLLPCCPRDKGEVVHKLISFAFVSRRDRVTAILKLVKLFVFGISERLSNP